MTGHDVSEEDEIRRFVSTWMAATNSGDVDTILSLIADDAVFLTPGRQAMTKAGIAAAAEAQSSADAPHFEGTSDIREIKVLGDWAFVWVELTVAVTPPRGRKFTRAGPALSILTKENGRWLLARDANMLSPVPNVSQP
jgi:uncharacterized protein (TIGR02246 family)